jgi:nitrite reductase/ring-hydroxylating ferredoxin subunit
MPTLTPVRVLADTRALGEGRAVRFAVVLDGVSEDALALRWHGRVHAYVNRCRHQGLPLDFGDGHVFDDDYDAIVCCHHGARYRPDTGECLGGPCGGGRLTALVLEQRGAELWCVGAAPRTRPGGREA